MIATIEFMIALAAILGSLALLMLTIIIAITLWRELRGE